MRLAHVRLSLGAISTLLCVAAGVCVSSAAASESTTYQINPQHTGYAPETPVYAQPQRLWLRDLGNRGQFPLIADGRVFAVINPADRFPEIHALDLATGEALWTRTVPSSIQGLAYEDGRLFTVDGDGLIRSLSAETGATLWSGTTIQARGSGPPVVSDGVVYALSAISGVDLEARSAASGAEAWHQHVSVGTDGVPTVGPSSIFLSDDCNTASFTRATGVLGWYSSGSGCVLGFARTAVLAGPFLFVRDRPGTPSDRVLSAADGSFQGACSADPAPAISPSTIAVLSGSTLTGGSVPAGSFQWTFQGDGALSTAPIIVGNRVAIGSTTGNLYWLDATTGSVVFSENVGRPISPPAEGFGGWSGLAAGEGALVVPANGRLVAYAYGPVVGSGPPPDDTPSSTPAQSVPTADAVARQINPAHDGFLDAADPRSPLRQRWSVDAGALPGYALIVDGLVISVVDSPSAAMDSSIVKAYSQSDGQFRWQAEIAGDSAGLAYDRGTIYAVTEPFQPSPDPPVLHAIRATDGAPVFSVDVPGSTSTVTAAPTADAGHVYVNAMTGTDSHGRIFAFDGATGAAEWDKVTSGEGDASSPAVDGSNVYVSHSCRGRSAFARVTGTPLWPSDTQVCSAFGGSTPSVGGDRVYGDGGFVFDSSTGEILDRTSNSGEVSALVGDTVISQDGQSLVAEGHSGRWRWMWPSGSPSAYMSPPVDVGDTVFEMAGTTIYAIARSTGTVEWSEDTGGQFPWSPARPRDIGLAAGDGLLVVPSGTRLIAYESAPSGTGGGGGPEGSSGSGGQQGAQDDNQAQTTAQRVRACRHKFRGRPHKDARRRCIKRATRAGARP